MAAMMFLVVFCNFIGFPYAVGDVQFNTTVAVVKGQSIRIPCGNNDSDETIHWYYYSFDNSKQLVYNGEEMSPQFAATSFSTDTASPGQCDLVVNYTKITDAGKYECIRHISSPGRPDRSKPIVATTVQLTVLYNSPSCSYNANSSTITDGYVVRNDFIFMTCSLNYSGSSRPVITWLRKDRQDSLSGTHHHFTISSKFNLYGTTSKISVHVSEAAEILFYTCMASFSIVLRPEGATSFFDDPNDDFQCDLTFIVAYEVRNVRISPYRNQYSIGDQLTCTAEGTPSPMYEWHKLGITTSKVINGPILNVTEDMANNEYIFQCQAYNTVAGKRKSNSENITFTVTDKSRIPIFTVTILMGIMALMLMIIVIYLGKEPIKDLVARLRSAAQVVPDIEPDILPNAVGCQREDIRENQEYVGYAQPEDIIRALNPMAIVAGPEFPVYASIDDTLQERNSVEMKEARMPCDGKAEESGPSALKHPDNTKFPVYYAEINKNKKEMIPEVKPEVEFSVSEASAKVDGSNMIVAADGTEYMDMNTVRNLRDTVLSVSPYEEPLFNKSVYAAIDHSAAPPPPPKED